MFKECEVHQGLQKFKNLQFKKNFDASLEQDLAVYDLKYYEIGLNLIEQIHEGEYDIGRLRLKRQYVISAGLCNNMFTYHTSIRDSSLSDEELKATFCLVHGYGENSDIFLESGI